MVLCAVVINICERKLRADISRVLIIAPDKNEVLGVLVGKIAHQNSAGYTEDCGIRADAQSQSGNSNGAEAGAFHRRRNA